MADLTKGYKKGFCPRCGERLDKPVKQDGLDFEHVCPRCGARVTEVYKVEYICSMAYWEGKNNGL